MKKTFFGLVLGLVLALILLNIDKKLWLPFEFETINARNTFNWNVNKGIETEDVITIVFDDKSKFLLRRGGKPVKDFSNTERTLIKEAIEKLESYGVKSIGINLNLNNPSDPVSDLALIETLKKYKNIVVATSIYSFQPNVPNKILDSASSVGYGELFAEYDKVVHKIDEKDIELSIPSFSTELYRKTTGKNLNTNQFYLKYPKKPIKSISFIHLINGEVSPEEFKGKIVILGNGLKSKIIKDQLASPYEKEINDSEVQAVALLNLMQNKYASKFSLLNHPALFILLSIVFGVVFTNLQILRSMMTSTTLFIILLVVGQLAYTFNNLIIEIIPITFALFFNNVIGSLIFLQVNLHEQNKELELSQDQLQEKNKELSSTLSELNSRVEEVKSVRKQLSKRREEERKRIARELHDDTLARITDLKRFIETISTTLGIQGEGKEKLLSCTDILDGVTKEVRRIINALRPSMLDNVLGLLPAIENLLDDLSKRSEDKIKSRLITSITKLRLSESADIHIYRIVQEALNNVFKHSNATKVDIQIVARAGELMIVVSDDGVGYKENKENPGYGLIDMRERADLIGATIQYVNKPAGAGTAIEVTLPIREDYEIEFESKETTTA